MQKSTTSIRG